jgi:hypothetical protein
MSAAKYFSNWMIGRLAIFTAIGLALSTWGGLVPLVVFGCTWFLACWVERRTYKLRVQIEIEKVMSDNGELKDMISALQDIANKAEEVKRGD